MVEDDVDMKAKIEKILIETNNSENRAAKMDVNDLLRFVKLSNVLDTILTVLLRLLSAFHDAGIHFA